MSKLACKVAMLVLFGAVAANAQSRSAPAEPIPILVELFTSEGCSDCPPADNFLRTLDSTQPLAGAQLIVLEEHVDYWDDLGWRDPFSSRAFTVRQQHYVNRMRLASAYTPQMIVDGDYQFVGSDRRSAAKALESARSMQKVAVRLSAVRYEGGALQFRVDTEALPVKADLLVALALESSESQVAKGENGGRHLEHVAIVRDLAAVQKVDKGESFAKEVSLRAKPVTQAARLIVFLQEPNQGKVLGAAVERLPAEAAHLTK